jgi:hypothetical protein
VSDDAFFERTKIYGVPMKNHWIAVFVIAAVATVITARAETAPSLEGVWQVTEETFQGPNTSNNETPQPSLLIFTKKHYSFIRVVGSKPRALFQALIPTNEEKMRAFDSFTASSGTYELNGTILIMRPVVAKYPNFMSGGWEKYEVRIEGTDLWLMAKSADIMMKMGDRLAPLPGPETQSRRKLIRLE